MAPEFIYFDMGNVLLHFDHRRSAAQVARLMQVDPQVIWERLFAGDWNLRCDGGELTGPELHHQLCEQLVGTRSAWPSYEAFVRAASDIFAPNVPMLAIACQLRRAGYRLGLLSNTCDIHWQWIADAQRLPIFPALFEVCVLSYELRQLKPAQAIYQTAVARCGVEASRVFYIDDLEANVLGAREAGLDARLYTTPADFAMALRARGARFNW